MRILRLVLLAMILVSVACGRSDVESPLPEYQPPQPERIVMKHIEVSYSGDDIGEASSDGWIIKLYTDMEIDQAGNPIGPGYVLQLLLNAPYDSAQSGDASLLVGSYSSPMNSADFSPYTFCWGYMRTMELPGQRIEVGDGSFFASLEDGSIDMCYDLLNEGSVTILYEDGCFSISGVMVGDRCIKRYFEWSGNFEVSSTVEPAVPNSTLKSDLALMSFNQGQLQDKGDSFYLKDESYRCFLLFLAEEGVELGSGRPAADGDVLRVELLVPWTTTLEDGLPEGRYTVVPRNENSSIDRDKIVPFAAISGVPDCFTYPYIGGSWYFNLKSGQWTDYARIDEGVVDVARGEDGSHAFSWNFVDCDGNAVTGEVAGVMLTLFR